MSHIFISYSRQDSEYATRLAEFLEESGFDVWIDGRIDYGDRWWRTIVKAIEECAAFVVIMTPDAEQSEWVEREILLAQRDKKPLFPVLLKGREFALLITTQFADVRDASLPEQDFVTRLSQVVNPQGQTGKNIVPPEVIKTERQELLKLINNHITEPPERLKAGIRLAEIGDPRPGVGLDKNGLPDIIWVKIPAGQFLYGSNRDKDPLACDNEIQQHKIYLPEFYIAKYPITYLQFQAFMDAKDGFYDGRWWQGLAGRDTKPEEQHWKIANHPRENVSWYAAVAFCRWLDAQYRARGLSPLSDRGETRDFNPLPGVITLPTEHQWERAARGTDGWIYPWGNQYISGYANIDETQENSGKYNLQQTTAVGIYPQRASPNGIQDMSGNVREWCLNEYNSGEITINTEDARARRGGVWDRGANYARVTYRAFSPPNYSSNFIGFRLCVSIPMNR